MGKYYVAHILKTSGRNTWNFNYRMRICFQTLLAASEEEVKDAVKKMRSTEGPLLLEIKTAKGARSDLGRPKTTPTENKLDFMSFLAKD